jgi:beta-glucosidase
MGTVKKILKGLGILLGLALITILIMYFNSVRKVNNNLELLGDEAPVLVVNGHSYRDLNKNNSMDVYENINANIEDRLDDLIDQMSLEEKAGTMFITMTGIRANGDPYNNPYFPKSGIDMMINMYIPTTSDMVAKRLMNSFNIINSYDAELMARYNNNIQKMAERTRLGIPVTIATDPRHGTENNPGAAIFTSAFSQWPTSLGLAASRDTLLVREFGDIARQEYRSTGITLALHPMADLATEPRWGRINGTFGEDANLSAMMTKAYVLGFQGDSLDANGVACMTKHFSGGGPQKDGEDPHFPYGKEQVYPGNNFDYHVKPFIEGAFPARTAQIMPYYGIPMDQTDENVAFGFNRKVITEILRDSLGFDGVVCTDWNIISEAKIDVVRAWGVEELTPLERAKKSLNAGCDQFGGEAVPELVVELVHSGAISEERINTSVRRILKDKFKLGLFDSPYVDEAEAGKISGKETFRKKGKEAQGKSTVLLKNDNMLPLKKGTKIYAQGMLDPTVLSSYGEVVSNMENADVIVLRIQTPFDPRDEYMLESFFHQGRLFYSEEENNAMFELIRQKPTIVVVNLERPAILTDINAASKALIADFGTSDEVLADVLFGTINPSAKLPFELPSTWEAVQKQLEDVPYDSENPLFRFGFGLSYE